MNAITLYHLENERIKIDIEARFEGDVLVIEGYDIGKTVEEYWGDSDYEYTTNISPEEVAKLFVHFGIEKNDREKLLLTLAARYSGNKCYSEIQALLDGLNIRYHGFSWA